MRGLSDIDEDYEAEDINGELKVGMVRAYKGHYFPWNLVQLLILDESKLGKLEATVAKADNIKDVDKELIDRAKRLIELLHTKQKVRDSISSKEVKQLEDALKLVEDKGLQKKIGEDYGKGDKPSLSWLSNG